MKSLAHISTAILATLVGSTAYAQDLTASDGNRLELVAELRLPSDTNFDGIPFGGISGLFPLGDGRYVALSDDRSEKGNARFYEIAVGVDDSGALDVEILKQTTILTEEGTPYLTKTVDPEGIVFDAESGSYLWVSEVDLYKNPTMQVMTTGGEFVSRYDLPAGYFSTEEGTGDVDAASLESIAITPDGKTLYIATENGLQQDGPRATSTEATPVRIVQMDKSTGEIEGEYLYTVDPVGTVAIDQDQPFSDNGLAELYSLGDGRLIAVERNGWHVGNFEFHFAIKAYLVDLAGATNIQDIPSLKEAEVSRIQPARKTLLSDFSQLGLESVDNIEAMAAGPLVDGEPTMLFVSDNNFDGRQVTQFVLAK